MNILTIGGATQDVFISVSKTDSLTISKNGSSFNYLIFESGEKLEVETLSFYSGGGATNASTAFKRLGFTANVFCNIGNDSQGKQIIDSLLQEGVNIDHITRSSQPTGQSFILNTPSGNRTVFVHRGANKELNLSALSKEVIEKSNHLYITSLSTEASRKLPEITAHAKQHNVPVAINPGASQLAKGTLLLKQCLNNIDILIMNSSEARMFMAALAANDESYKEALESGSTTNACSLNVETNTPYLIQSSLLCQNQYFSVNKFFIEALKMGPKIVAITNGANGVYVATNNTMYFHPSLQTKAINTVGAGDAFGSCFVASILHNYSIAEALRNGIVNSSSVLEHLGAKAGLLTLESLHNKIQTMPNLVQSFTL